ncbi:MAG: ATP-binding protein [Elusimicrobiota bacterium]
MKTGEGLTLEFKRSTAELREGMHALCAFLNGSGGTLVFGIRPDGGLSGQQVSDKTMRELAQSLRGFEPPDPRISIERIPVSDTLEAIALHVPAAPDTAPYVFQGIPYERIHSTTPRMPQKVYERMLLERVRTRHRWENAVAEGLAVRDLDRGEISRVQDSARAAGRLSGPMHGGALSFLRRLRVATGNDILQAAVVLFGTDFLPYYPQCELRMARFRGLDKTEFLDQKQLRGPAFKLLDEAELFCQRHFPLPGRIEPGRLQRVDRPLIPPDAMREILVNALIHRDYAMAGAAVSLAVFDDRVEVWSPGTLPAGITPELLSQEHPSVQRNPIIAEVFHRAGLIEKWGRGTNRVIEQCRQHGIPPPKFLEAAGATVVRFSVTVGRTTRAATAPVIALLRAARQPMTRAQLQRIAGLDDREHFRKEYLIPLLRAGWLEMTIPEKPNSRLQRYLTTGIGLEQIRGSA